MVERIVCRGSNQMVMSRHVLHSMLDAWHITNASEWTPVDELVLLLHGSGCATFGLTSCRLSLSCS